MFTSAVVPRILFRRSRGDLPRNWQSGANPDSNPLGQVSLPVVHIASYISYTRIRTWITNKLSWRDDSYDKNENILKMYFFSGQIFYRHGYLGVWWCLRYKLMQKCI
jgi:hypothetical protein